MAKIITVFGATGQQGGAVARALVAAGTFKVRAVTRNVDSEKAKALSKAGVDVVKADIDDRVSVDAAVKESYGVFLVTNFWEHMSKDKEIAQGKLVADAAKEAGVKHLVYSGLENVQKIIGLECPHFDGKGLVEDYLDEIGLLNTSVRFAAYYPALVDPKMLAPRKQDDGTYLTVLCMDGPMHGVDPADCGPAIAEIFNQPGEFIGKRVGLAGDYLTIDEYLKLLAKATGKDIKYQQVPVDVFAKFPFPGASDLAAMFAFYSSGKIERDINLTKRLNPKTKSFEQWLEANSGSIDF